jgi:TfoX/Sxy family transcriptional regulator of competence genes
MAYDSGLADLLREALDDVPVTEKAMFGGLSFLLHGHMVCGVTKHGAIFRVGAPNDAAANALHGVAPMQFTGKPMSGFVEVSDDAMADDTCRNTLMTMSLDFVKSLPPKKPAPPKKSKANAG